jgi:hypothetical protein
LSPADSLRTATGGLATGLQLILRRTPKIGDSSSAQGAVSDGEVAATRLCQVRFTDIGAREVREGTLNMATDHLRQWLPDVAPLSCASSGERSS